MRQVRPIAMIQPSVAQKGSLFLEMVSFFLASSLHRGVFNLTGTDKFVCVSQNFESARV